MAHTYHPEFQPEQNPNVPWHQRGGFTTIAAISLILGAIGLIAIALGLIFGQLDLAAGYVPFPAVVGLIFGILGILGPWKWTAGAGIALNLAAMVFAMAIAAT